VGALVPLLHPPSFLFLCLPPQNFYGELGGIAMRSKVVGGLEPPLPRPTVGSAKLPMPATILVREVHTAVLSWLETYISSCAGNILEPHKLMYGHSNVG
jgi:hypothetical protein